MNNKLFLRMKMLPREEVTRTFVAYQRSENGKEEKGRESMIARGYEITSDHGPITTDGREIIEAYGCRWALNVEQHSLALAERIAHATPHPPANQQEKPKDTKSVAGTESLSNMVCPKCGDALQHSIICSKCPAGKIGYRHRYTCVCGGVDMVSKDKL